MDILIAFAVFIVCLILCLSFDITMILPLFIGFVIFSLVAIKRGKTVREVGKMSLSTVKDSLIVVRIILLLGCLTGLWRASGTIAYFVCGGVKLIPPALFVLAAFVLTAVMSFALGTSFGVTATGGVILMAIGRAGGINPVIVAGAVLSGVYVGDRASPAASSANLVAVLTGTDMRDNVRLMLKNSILPFVICCGIYTVLSLFVPMTDMNVSLLENIAGEFNLSWVCLIPAVLILALPFCNVSIILSILISMASAFAVAVFTQDVSVLQALKIMVTGFAPDDASLTGIFSGGGLVSMLEVGCILLLSGTYGGIFRGAGFLEEVDKALLKMSGKIGRYQTMLIMSFAICALFCNQTIGSIMQSELSAPLYGDSDEEKTARMMDIENSVILVAGLIPWCIACSVPLGMLNADAASVPFACYLYVLPLVELIKASRKQVYKID